MYAREGMDVSVLQYIMGHKSSYTAMRFYNHVTEERVLDTFKEHIRKKVSVDKTAETQAKLLLIDGIIMGYNMNK